MQSIANKKRHLGKATYDNGYGQFCTYLEYKLKDKGKPFIRVDKYFPSSQLCSVCGSRQKLELSERTYVCSDCGTVIDRDHNAAVNIRTEGLRILSAQSL